MTFVATTVVCVVVLGSVISGQPQTSRRVVVTLPPDVPAQEAVAATLCRNSKAQWIAFQEWRPVRGPSFESDVPAGRPCRVLVRLQQESRYLSSQEVSPGASAGTVAMLPHWRRTLAAEPSDEPLFWIGALDEDAVECDAVPEARRCLFVPVDAPGVLLSRGSDRIQFALVRAGEPALVWQSSAWGRMIRVHPLAEPVSAQVVVMRPVLRHGAGQMREARAASGVRLHRLAPAVFWIEGAGTPAGDLELRSPGAALTRIPLASFAGPADMPAEIPLPAEEILTGEVRSHGAVLEGATVMLARRIDNQGAPPERSQGAPPLELIAETVTAAGGTFRFGGLAAGSYELLALHPSRGRATSVTRASGHVRLELRPRAAVRGRVLREGVPVAGASAMLVPSLEAVASARNPMTLGAEPVLTGPDGRFQVIAPDEGSVMLVVMAEGAAFRAPMGDAKDLGAMVDLGDIVLEAAFDVEVAVALPAGCELQAAGPMGATGLSVVRGVAAAPGRWTMRFPLRGRWLFAAVCAEKEIAVDPPMVEVPPPQQGIILLKVRI
jgi:hypothetical protein